MKHLLAILAEGRPLTSDQTSEAFELIMTGEAEPAQVGALLSMIQLRGPHMEEIVGAARVMRAKAVSVEVPAGLVCIDTCGTGGDGSSTFNISTAAAIVAAGAGRQRGVVVAKHGNRSITSKSGSSQVLEALGVTLGGQPQALTRCLDEAGLCFCFAPAHHPAMKHVMPTRQALGFRTLFNILGPLTNPAGATRQVMGVFDPALTEPLAGALGELGSKRAMVVHGGGVDELITTGPTRISELRDGRVKTWEFDPATLHLAPSSAGALEVDSPQGSAAVIHRLLEGEAGPARDIVTLNAAAALTVADLANDLAEGLTLACKAIDSGAARRVLERLVELTTADPVK